MWWHGGRLVIALVLAGMHGLVPTAFTAVLDYEFWGGDGGGLPFLVVGLAPICLGLVVRSVVLCCRC